MIKLFLLIFIFASAYSRRVSEEKCQEYKDMLKQTQCVGFSVFDPCLSKIATYDCSDVENTELSKKRNSFVREDAKSGEFPHIAAIGWNLADRSVTFRCEGSLISDRFVLTTAHCGWHPYLESQPTFVRLGIPSLATNGTELVERKIKTFIEHPDYSSYTYDNDIALIELCDAVSFHRNFLWPACLQQQDNFDQNITLSGWFAKSTYGHISDDLLKSLIPVVQVEGCKEFYNRDIFYKEIQICGRGSFPCNGGNGIPVHYLDWIEGIVWPKEGERKQLPPFYRVRYSVC